MSARDPGTAYLLALPPPSTAAGLKPAAAALTAANAAGCELGPRGPHIRMLGATLSQNLDRLRTTLAPLDMAPGLRAELETALDAVADAADLAGRYTE